MKTFFFSFSPSFLEEEEKDPGLVSFLSLFFFPLPQPIAQCLAHHESSINIWSMNECVSKKKNAYAINYTPSDFLYAPVPILVSIFMEK